VSNLTKTKYVHEGHYVAEVQVELVESDDSWSPCLSIEDAYKLDDAREALKKGNLEAASQYGKVFELRPIASA